MCHPDFLAGSEQSSCSRLMNRQGMIDLPRRLKVAPFSQPLLVMARAEFSQCFGWLLEGFGMARSGNLPLNIVRRRGSLQPLSNGFSRKVSGDISPRRYTQRLSSPQGDRKPLASFSLHAAVLRGSRAAMFPLGAAPPLQYAVARLR